MSRASGVLAAMKAVPGGARYTPAPQSGGWGGMNSVAANAMYGNPAASQNGYGPFLPRPSRAFTDGAFGPMSPIQPVPVDQPPPGGEFPDPRWWQYRTGWNLPTQPGTEGLKLASFDQLYTLASKYSVARACIELRKEEIRGLDWEIQLTPKAAKAYQGDHKAMRDFGERAAEATRFFRHPDPDFWNFGSFLDALLEEIFVYDALALVFRPKYGKGLGRGLLGSDLDSIRLVSGPTVRPLLDMHGGKPRPPAPAYQQFLYGVPRSDYQTIIAGSDIDDYGLAGAEVNSFRAGTMLYAPLVSRRETPYGFPPVERALLPIISGLQKQEFQLDYFQEGTVPACYISPGDPNMTPTQIRELQDALNGIAGDPAYHLKVIVLPPGSKVDPQRNVDLSDSFDLLVQLQVAMAFDVQPIEVDILPNIGGAIGGGSGVGASAARFAAQEARDIKSRKSTKPLLMYLGDIFNYALQDICGQQDMQFAFEGLTDDEDKADITELGVQQVQNGIASIDEVRERLDLAPWGLSETSEPVVFTAQGPIPFSLAPQLIANMQNGGQGGAQGTNSGQKTPSSRSRTSQPSVRAGGQTKPNGTHPKPVAPHRESITPGHSAAAGAIQSPTPRTGGTPSRTQAAGSRKRGEAATRRASSHKAVQCELEALERHLNKGRHVSTWVPEHIPGAVMACLAEDLTKGISVESAVDLAAMACVVKDGSGEQDDPREESRPFVAAEVAKAANWPGWEHDLGLVGRYKQEIGQAFHDAETRGSELRKKAATGAMFVSNPVLRDLISDEVREVFSGVLTPLWTEAWHLGYAAAKSLATGQPADFTAKDDSDALRGFIGSEGEHWLAQISRTGLGNNSARSELIARTEVARAINSAAIQCYRDHGIAHKHLLLSPGACDICKDAADDGDIPLDAPFSAGGILGLAHPACRCVPAPAGIEADPPLAGLSKSAAAEDPSRAAFLMLRARHPGDGKLRYLLQMRPDGTWGLPGGSTHQGEHPLDAAVRESTEEIGDLPALGDPAAILTQAGDDKIVWIHVHDVPFFQPANNGSTPEETAGTGWFKRKEVGDLDLHPPFRRQWESGDWKNIGKALQRVVNEDGEVLTLDKPAQRLQATGARWPYPHRADGAEDANGSLTWPDAGPGAVPSDIGSAGGEPPGHFIADGAQAEPHGDVAPRGGEDGRMPGRRKPNPPATEFPDQGEEDQDAWPYPQVTLTPSASPVGANTGVPPSGVGKNDSGHPVVGSIPAETPRPYEPHSVEAQSFDPGETVMRWSPGDGSNVVHNLPGIRKSGASDYNDANPVDAEHVYLQLAKNFPADAISWVRRASWVGPIWVPWDRIDTDDRDKWAASHQAAKVDEFAAQIKDHAGRVAPSVLVQEPNSSRAFIVDGHHRALAREKLGQKVLAYLGNINPKDREVAEQTHNFQVHQGADPGNK
jgi:8-oxo-dGTP pyrophosphatase MutT (NUDIX family)